MKTASAIPMQPTTTISRRQRAISVIFDRLRTTDKTESNRHKIDAVLCVCAVYIEKQPIKPRGIDLDDVDGVRKMLKILDPIPKSFEMDAVWFFNQRLGEFDEAIDKPAEELVLIIRMLRLSIDPTYHAPA